VHQIAEVLQKNTYNIQVLGMVGSLLGLLQPGKVMWLQLDPRLASQSQQQKNSLMQAW
jgi:hypothetical protein